MEITYTNISKLKIPIYLEPYCHIKSKELDEILKKNKINRKKFSEYFGCQTALLLDDGQIGYYPCDVEPILERLINRKVTGNQKSELWD